MNDIAVTKIRPAVGASSLARRHGRQANDWLAFFLVLFAGLMPIPFGSNRPIFWLISALVLATIGLVYAIDMLREKSRFRFEWRLLLVPGVLVVIWLGFLTLQILPLGLADALVPFETGRGATIASSRLSLTPGDTVLMIVRYVSYMLFFVLMMQVSVNRDRVRKIVMGLLGIFAAHALYAMLALTQFGDTILIFEKWAYSGVATGTFVNRNSFATFLAMGMVLCLAALFREANLRVKKERKSFWGGFMAPESRRLVIYFMIMVLLLITLISTSSRMGLFAALAGTFFVAAVSVSKMEKPGWRVVSTVFWIGALGGGVFLYLFGGGLLERLGNVEVAAGVRGDLYHQVWQMIWARPLTGFGGGSFEMAFPLYHELPVNPDFVWDKAHSTYLGLWVETGLVFGSIPLIILGYFAYQTFRAGVSRARDWMTPVAAFGVIVVAGVHSMVDFSLEIQANVYILLAIVALGMTSGKADPEKVTTNQTG